MHETLLLGLSVEFRVQIGSLFALRLVLLDGNAIGVGPGIQAVAPPARVAPAYLFVRITSCCS